MKKFLPVLLESELFSGMDCDNISSFLECMGAIIRKYSKDEIIFHMGDYTKQTAIILTGSVLTVKEDIWGRRHILAMIKSGETLAESFAAAKESLLTVNAIANSDCELLFLNIDKMLSVCSLACDAHNLVIRNLISVLAEKNLMFNEKITHMSRRTTREKLLSYLSSEARIQKSLSFDIPFDRQQLADYLSVERAAMSVELSKLQRDGLLKTKNKHFELFIDSQQ